LQVWSAPLDVRTARGTARRVPLDVRKRPLADVIGTAGCPDPKSAGPDRWMSVPGVLYI